MSIALASGGLRVLTRLPILANAPGWRAALTALVEVTAGVRALAGLSLPFALRCGLAAAGLGWGGLAVAAQLAAFCPSFFRFGNYLRSRLFHALWAGLVSWGAVAALGLRPEAESAATVMAGLRSAQPAAAVVLAALGLCMALPALANGRGSGYNKEENAERSDGDETVRTAR